MLKFSQKSFRDHLGRYLHCAQGEIKAGTMRIVGMPSRRSVFGVLMLGFVFLRKQLRFREPRRYVEQKEDD